MAFKLSDFQTEYVNNPYNQDMKPGIYYIGCKECGFLMGEQLIENILMEKGKLHCWHCKRDIDKEAVIEHLTKVNVKLREKNNELSNSAFLV